MHKKALWIVSILSFIAVMSAAVRPATGHISETTLLGLTCVGIAGVLFLLRRRRPAPI